MKGNLWFVPILLAMHKLHNYGRASLAENMAILHVLASTCGNSTACLATTKQEASGWSRDLYFKNFVVQTKIKTLKYFNSITLTLFIVTGVTEWSELYHMAMRPQWGPMEGGLAGRVWEGPGCAPPGKSVKARDILYICQTLMFMPII